MRLIFIRHGDPDYVADSLTEKGRREAELLSRRTANWDITRIYCSPLGRAQATAAPTLEKRGETAVTCDWLQEFFLPMSSDEFGQRMWPWDLDPSFWTTQPDMYHRDKWYDTPFMRTGDVKGRYLATCQAFDQLLAEYGYLRDGNLYRVQGGREDTLVFFCHHGLACVLLSHLMGVSPVILWHSLYLSPTSVTAAAAEEVVPGEAYFRFQCIGDTSHLRAGGEPVSAAGYFTEPFQD